MKIQKITLKEYEIREVDGEYETVYFNEKTYPAFLSNYALKKGKEMGLIQTSILSELHRFVEMSQTGSIANLNEENMLNVVYLGFISANRKVEMSYEDFLDRYHYSVMETAELYGELIEDAVDREENNFAKGFEDSADKSKSGKK
ncbi:hypothetical protein J14TS2_17210 [Bacillus sp. J14TS2]|uniref:hypothetical protein n=1 Tax=Bacillus sp. J14TS2 TaxID=2807188 RepID=UPI001B0D482C|nr:hypothetical protein [Bacillus sp. J14TS2]GIN71246.1 hypothetical protein J14TS2_17210 [Bacillus sp. J14TS2]